MKAVIFSNEFLPPDELKEFCKSLGYDTILYYLDYDLMFDPRVVEFCEQHSSNLWGEKVYKGRDSYVYRCGFAGAGYIRDIDTTKKWRIKYNNVDSPIIYYVDVITNKYGYTYTVPQKILEV